MHATAVEFADLFFRTYAAGAGATPGGKVLDVGSQDVNGSLRSVAPATLEYVGVDFAPAKGVDIVLTDPYVLPFEDASFDYCVSSSVFEHSEMFWLLYLEILRVLKPAGLFYCNAPSNGSFHRYPVDCWRFYPDSGNALVNWAKRNGGNPLLLESFIARQGPDEWNDCVAVHLKDAAYADRHVGRMSHSYTKYLNGFVAGSADLGNPTGLTEDQALWRVIKDIVRGDLPVVGPEGCTEDQAKLHVIREILQGKIQFDWS